MEMEMGMGTEVLCSITLTHHHTVYNCFSKYKIEVEKEKENMRSYPL